MEVRARIEALTPRQRDVLELLSKGLTNREIAGVLDIALETVKSHVRAVLAALDVTNRAEAAGLANAADAALAEDFDRRPAIAVLPFGIVGLVGHAPLVFAVGLADDLIRLFSRWRWFPVIARTSTDVLAPKASEPARALGARLGARYLVSGRVHADGERFRLSVSVDDADADRCVWSERYEVPAKGLFELQDALAAEIVGAVFPRLVAAEIWRARRTRGRTFDGWLEAHRALWLVGQRAPEKNEAALALLDRLPEGDDELAPAIHARGLALFQEILNGWCADIGRSRELLHAEAERAVRLFAEAPMGHLLRARAAMLTGDAKRAIEHAEVATAIDPSLAEGHAFAGQLYAMEGRHEAGLARMERARRLSPNAYVAAHTIALFAAGRYVQARAACEAVCEDRPRYVFARIVLIAACLELGDRQSARAHARRLLSDYPSFRTRDMQRIYAQHTFEVGDRVLDALHAVGVPQ